MFANNTYKTRIGRAEFESDNLEHLFEKVNEYHYDHSGDLENTASVIVEKDELGNECKERWNFLAFDVDGQRYVSRVCSSGIWRKGGVHRNMADQWERAARKLGVPVDQLKCNEDEWMMGE